MWFQVKVRHTVIQLVSQSLAPKHHIAQHTLFARLNRLSTEKNCLNFVFIRVGRWCAVVLFHRSSPDTDCWSQSKQRRSYTHLYCISGESNSIPESLTLAQLLCVTYVCCVCACVFEKWENEREWINDERQRKRGRVRSRNETQSKKQNRISS